MASFDRIKPGDVLYDVHRRKTGHVDTSVLDWWPVVVVSVDPDSRTAMCRWNGNTARTYSERNLNKLRRNKPLRKK